MKTRSVSSILAVLIALLVSGCASKSVQQYAGEQPVLKLSDYLNGDIVADGFFQNRSGKVVKRFHVTMKGTWVGDSGTLDENFEYSDGTKSQRIWHLTRQGSHYTGTAADVVGVAHGEESGNAFHWEYTLNLEAGGSFYHVAVDDWMYLLNSKLLLNKTKMSKLGFRVGEVTLSFSKR
jgi:hypothetical protein